MGWQKSYICKFYEHVLNYNFHLRRFFIRNLICILRWWVNKQTLWLESIQKRKISFKQESSINFKSVYLALGISFFACIIFFFFDFNHIFFNKEHSKLTPEQIRNTIYSENSLQHTIQKAVKPWKTSRDFRKSVGVLHIGMPELEKVTLDPLEIMYYPKLIALHGVYRNLVKIDEKGQVVPDIALSWAYKNGNRTIIFELDPKAHFDDGSPITGKDVAYTFSRIFWPGVESTGSYSLREVLEGAAEVKIGETVSGIIVLDPLHVQFKLKAPRPTLLHEMADLGAGILPKNKFNKVKPLGSGPVHVYYNSVEGGWSFSRHMAPDAVTHIKTAHLKYLRILPIEMDVNRTKKRILSGELDLVFGFGLETFHQMQLPKEYVFRNFPINGIAHFYYNMKKPLFSDREFRRDLSMLVQNIADEHPIPAQLGTRLRTYLPPELMPTNYYDRKVEKPSVQAFKEKWADKMPNKIQIVLLKNTLEKSFMENMNKCFEEIGIQLVWKEYAGYKVFPQSLSENEYDILFGRYATSSSHVDFLMAPLDPKDTLRYSNADTSELFRKIYEYKTLPNWAERMLAYQEAFAEFEAQHYFIPMFQFQIPVIAHQDLFIGDLKYYNYNYETISYWKLYWKNLPEESRSTG